MLNEIIYVMSMQYGDRENKTYNIKNSSILLISRTLSMNNASQNDDAIQVEAQ